MRSFQATLTSAERGPGCALVVPFDVKGEFGRARAQVVVTVNNGPPFRTTISTYGGQSWIGLRKDQQQAFGVTVGDRVDVVVEPDTQPRVVEIPDDLGTAFEGAPNAAARFATLSYTHRREYVRWITEAKRQATRDTRVAKTIEMLRQGVRTPASQYANEVTNGADS